MFYLYTQAAIHSTCVFMQCIKTFYLPLQNTTNRQCELSTANIIVISFSPATCYIKTHNPIYIPPEEWTGGQI